MNKKIALVLVTYNRSSLLKEVLLSALSQTILPNAIYIIDNNSTDNTKDLIDTISSDNKEKINIIYHNTGYNAGGAGGFKIGSEKAYKDGFDLIWLSDDDVVFDSYCLENLINNIDKGDILQPLRMNTDGSCAEISGINYKINNPFYLNPKRDKIVDVYNQNWDTYELRTIPFEGPLIKREVFDKIGFPDENFFIFYDDLDFAIRANNAGFKILCVKKAKMIRKILFVQNRALNSWKGYFMYRNFFRVQSSYAKKPIALFRCIMIYLLVSIYSILTLKLKSIKILYCALKDGLSKDFNLNENFKP